MIRKHRGSPKELLPLNAYVKLVRAADAVTTATHKHLMDVNLTISQFGILEALYHLGPMCQRDVAKKILKSTANITTVIDNLEKRKLVKRQRSKDDRRFNNLCLTGKGQQLAEQILPGHFKGIVKRFEALTLEEQRQLARLCKKLGVTTMG